LNYLLDKHQVDRHRAVMVGDRNLDIEAGHNAGIAGYLFDIDA
jgi:phosphoglycolate phosphatase-like HAD superfamily hydrolase